jgi:hypothetical protein
MFIDDNHIQQKFGVEERDDIGAAKARNTKLDPLSWELLTCQSQLNTKHYHRQSDV